MNFEIEQIKEMIYVIREQKVLLDSDLAKLYGVETKRLNEQVRRNLDRFPEDFMFECNSNELEVLKSQIATSKSGSRWNYKRRTIPMVFTENGVAMLSSVLNSKQAVQVNISIMRIFTKLRSFHAFENRIDKKFYSLEQNVTQVFKAVFERLDAIEGVDINKKRRKKIGLNESD